MLKFSKIVVLLIVFSLFLSACNNQEVLTLKLDDGSIYYEGEVNENNEPHGKGVYYYDNQNMSQIEGNFVNGVPHGYAVWHINKSKNTVQFDGEWDNGEPIFLTPKIGMTKYDITSKTELGFDYDEYTDGNGYELWSFPKHSLIVVFDNKEKVIELRNE